jgi:hypothetical protein
LEATIIKAETGLKTNKIPVLIAALEEKMAAIVSECQVFEDSEK